MLVPVSPHLAKTVYNGNSPSLFVGGNTNLCQDGLANARPVLRRLAAL